MIKSRLIQLLLSDWLLNAKRRIKDLGDAGVTLFYEPGDPWSHLCATQLSQLQQRLSVDVHICIVPPPDDLLYPFAEKQRQWAINDAQQMAPTWGLGFTQPPQPFDSGQQRYVAKQLLGATSIEQFLNVEPALVNALWAQQAPSSDCPETAKKLSENNATRSKLGHYLPAMWHFRGEWFWGLDRFDLLEERLRAAKAVKGNAALLAQDLDRFTKPAVDNAQLEYFFSFRSPYSVLSVPQVKALVAQTKVDLVVRPVLPMAMRGLSVPLSKRLYIARDAKRLARHLKLPFGLIADPIGDGALRALAVFPLAKGVKQQLNFLEMAGFAAFSEGIDLATDKGMKTVCRRAGINWADAQQAMLGGNIEYAKQNQQILTEDLKLWGVPSFRLGKNTFWGQDRIALIAQLLSA